MAAQGRSAPRAAAAAVADDKEKKVSVAIRIRPRLEQRGERYETGIVSKADCKNVSCINPRHAAREQYHFMVDHVFDGGDSQEEVYETAAADMALCALDGGPEGRRVGNVILTYGQTGSGKTYTLLGKGLGPKDELTPESGIFLRALYDILRFKNKVREQHLVIRLAIIEVYNEQLRDLLNDRQTLHYTERGEDIVPRNPQTWTINSIGQVKRAFQLAHNNRAVACTQMNDESSRSHALFIVDLFQQVKCKDTPLEHLEELVRSGHWDLTLSAPQSGIPFTTSRYQSTRGARYTQGAGGGQRERSGARVRSSSLTLARSQSMPPFQDAYEAEPPLSPAELQAKHDIQQQYPITMSNLTMVDLAGSERTKRSAAAGSVFKEAVAVNTSLSVLGKVVNDIVQHAAHVPFRESMLTRLLRASFMCDRSKILLIANVAPTESSYNETRDSLKFADRLQMLRPPEGQGGAFRPGDSEREAEYRLCLRQCEALAAELRVAAEQCGYTRQVPLQRAPWPPLPKKAAEVRRAELLHRYREAQAKRDDDDRRRSSERQELLVRQHIEHSRREREAGDPQIALDRDRVKQLHQRILDEGRSAEALRKELKELELQVDSAARAAEGPHQSFTTASAMRRELSTRLAERASEEHRIQSEIDQLRSQLRDVVEPELAACRRSRDTVQAERDGLLRRDLQFRQRVEREFRQRVELVDLICANYDLKGRNARLLSDQQRAEEGGAAEELPRPKLFTPGPPGVSPLTLHFSPHLRPPPYIAQDDSSPGRRSSGSEEGAARAASSGARSLPPQQTSAPSAFRAAVPGEPLAPSDAAPAPAPAEKERKRPRSARKSRKAAGGEAAAPKGERPARLSRRARQELVRVTQKGRIIQVCSRLLASEECTNEDGLELIGILQEVQLTRRMAESACEQVSASPTCGPLDFETLKAELRQESVLCCLRALQFFPGAPELIEPLHPINPKPSVLEFIEILCWLCNEETNGGRSR
eukprot:TRINITY_DN21943_c0_g1_i1.p1 TRINITY_DN21943_c0_g1~~TRINITY_DN21943_c0_g1_i1.p1  ORF type:complete len:1018 (+),score=382.28 TRINITY_DN21943_c0_g1_i1:88-3054(+)